MMHASPARNKCAASSNYHRRRLPAHLSVWLRHESPTSSANATDTRGLEGKERQASFTVSPARDLSDDSNNSGDSSGHNVQRWFDRSNNRPERGFIQNLEDSKSCATKFTLCRQ